MVKPRGPHATAWKLWCDTKPEGDKVISGFYGDRLHDICNMKDIAEYHQHDSYMKDPLTIPKNTNLYVFQDSMRPMWEHFPDGGCWSYKVKRGEAKLASIWDKLVHACIHDGIGSRNVSGIVLSSRAKEISINVWLVSGQTSELRFEIMERLRTILDLHEGDNIQYKDFQTAIKDDSSKLNAVTYRVKDPTAHVRKYVLPDPVTGSFTFNY